jgi:hypothetical protein
MMRRTSGACLSGALLALMLAAAPASLCAASPFSEAADLLDGEWEGTDFVLHIDAKRAQASVDPDRPFEWRRFVVREVTPTEVVFAIGSELFEARVDSDILVLTSTGFRGERILFRGAPLRGTTDE